MARHAGYSPRSFARRFRAETGTTPLQWLIARRVAEAQRLLEGTATCRSRRSPRAAASAARSGCASTSGGWSGPRRPLTAARFEHQHRGRARIAVRDSDCRLNPIYPALDDNRSAGPAEPTPSVPAVDARHHARGDREPPAARVPWKAVELWTCHLGTVEYREAAALQESLRERVIAGELPALLLLLEHPPSTRSAAARSPATSRSAPTSGARAGSTSSTRRAAASSPTTGPGQLVGYPIMRAARASPRSCARWRPRSSPRSPRRGSRRAGATTRGRSTPACGSRTARSPRSACTSRAA